MRGVGPGIIADIAVLGLGPAGASAAAAAARTGLNVVAFDRKAEAGLPVQCAEFVPAMIGQEAGGLSASFRQSIDAMDTFVEDGECLHTPEFRGTMISRADFDRELVRKAEACGARCRFASPVRGIAADGSIRLASGGIIHARIIIGADGPRSLAGKAIGQINRDCVESRQMTVPLLKPHTATDIFLSAAIAGGYGWLFPKRAVANLGLGVSPRWKSLLKPLLDDLHARLVTEGRVGAEVIALTGGLIPVGGMLEPSGRIGKVQVLLAGDAAGLANPVTGAGINAAVLSGAMAGRAAAALLAGDARAAGDYRDELADLFGASLARALARRRTLLRRYDNGSRPERVDLKSAWIAYPEYWAA
jgi:digeranylgeranylglycerophospholipid reductase